MTFLWSARVCIISTEKFELIDPMQIHRKRGNQSFRLVTPTTQ
jgi:hypothetical protein